MNQSFNLGLWLGFVAGVVVTSLTASVVWFVWLVVNISRNAYP